MVFALAIVLNASQPAFGSTLETNSTILSFILTAFMIGVPIFLAWYLKKHHRELTEPKFKNRIGMLYGNLEVDKLLAVMYYPFFLARRLLITLIIVFLKDYPFAQVQILLFSSSLYLIYFGLYEP